MHSALYYPFTEFKNPNFLKTSLFLWDSVDVIVPYSGFRPHGRNSSEERALELIVNPHVPTEQNKEAAHKELEDICANGLPDELRFELQDPEKVYEIYPQKLFSKTWDLLEDSQLAKSLRSGEDRHSTRTGQSFAYYMMSILAVCCGDGKRRLVTDQNDPYRSLYHLLADVASDGNTVMPDDWRGRLLALSFNGLNFSDVRLSQLVDLRTKEDAMFYDLRRHFLAKIDSATEEISSQATSSKGIKDVLDEFSRSMEVDLSELKKALRKNATDMILSKEFACGVTAIALQYVEPISASVLGASVIGVGGLTKSVSDYRDRRRKLLKEHPSAWLFAAQSGTLPLY